MSWQDHNWIPRFAYMHLGCLATQSTTIAYSPLFYEQANYTVINMSNKKRLICTYHGSLH